MRFAPLSPPRRLASLPRAAPGADGDRHPQDVRHRPLAAPIDADFSPRHLLDPKDGWFRRTERELNKLLSRRVFPLIPFVRRPYAAILDRQLTVSEARIPLPGLTGNGCRVLVIADLHAGPFLCPQVLERTLERLMQTRPDLVLLPGDFATVCVEELEEILPVLSRVQAPCGVFGVLGNHDHYTGKAERVIALLSEAGIEILHNGWRLIDGPGGRFQLAGIDDLLGGKPELDRALDSQPPGLPTVLMSHNPDIFPLAVERGVGLVIAGHTHGGQIRLPGLPVLVRMSRFHLDEGRYQVGDAELIVTRGLGVVGLPLRLACPPEALLLELVPPPAVR